MVFSEDQVESEIYILDDDDDVRETLSVILGAAGYKPISFADEFALLETMRQRCPTCILLDVKLPGRSGLEILKDLADYPAPVIMISGNGDIPTAVNAIKSGAVDFVQKPFKGSEIVGRLAKLVEDFSHRKTDALAEKLSALKLPGREPLSRREREVLQLLVSGTSSNKEVGLALGLSPRTVEEYRANIMRKFGVKNAVEMMVVVMG